MAHSGNEFTGLFAEQRPAPRRGLPALAASTLLHSLGIAAIAYALLHTPTLIDTSGNRFYHVRHLAFQMPETAASRAAEKLYPKPNPAAQADRHQSMEPATEDPGAGPAQPQTAAALALPLPEGGNGPQTLVQPRIHIHQALSEETPIPAAVVWTPELKEAIKVVPPKPMQVTTADAETSLELPNEELELAKLPESAAKTPTPLQTPPAASTTPIAAKVVDPVKLPPATASTSSDEPTPAAVLSVSDVRMNQGTAVLPPVNEVQAATKKDGAPQTGSVLAAHPAAGGGGTGVGAKTAPAVADAATAAEPQFSGDETSEHIQLPKNGRFGVIVVGSSLADTYPETVHIWSDRVAYSAYLHVGTQKAWILQYAQLRTVDAAAGGAVAKLDAPWPYDIQRPNLLSKDLNADALMVHGILNESGKLEQLAIAYPQGYVHSSFVLHELGRWQFRPAQQLGKPTAVEVLLIIPEEDD